MLWPDGLDQSEPDGLCYAMLCYAVLCYAMLCYAKSKNGLGWVGSVMQRSLKRVSFMAPRTKKSSSRKEEESRKERRKKKVAHEETRKA